MEYVQGEGRKRVTLFPVCLEELIPGDHVPGDRCVRGSAGHGGFGI